MSTTGQSRSNSSKWSDDDVLDGDLEVTVQNESHFLSNNVPFVVRDGHHAVVRRGTVGSGSRTPLPEGLYSVAVVTPTGAESTRLVHVQAGVKTPLVFADEELGGDVFEAGAEPGLGAALGEGAPEPQPVAAELVSTDQCTVTSTWESGWEFAPVAAPDIVPTAVIATAGTRWELSLPLNPAATEPELSTCRVEAVTVDGSTRVRVAFARRRRVSRMVDGLLRNDAVAAGAEVLDLASDLLLHKYADPPGAVLGGLTLHRMGRLQKQRGWVENLARDFTWLPDGQVLCAALLMKDAAQAERSRGLDLLLTATRHRPMYTDGLSLATVLLRRWPDPSSEKARMKGLERLADYASYADWDSVNLCVDITERKP